jgi:beta-N-acetylhexosaminidase
MTRRTAVQAGAALGGAAWQASKAIGQNEATPDTRPATNDLTLREMIGQLFIVGVEGTALLPEEADRLTDLKPGGVLLVGRNVDETTDFVSFTDAIRATNPSYPPLLCVYQEGGVVRRIMADHGPSAPELGQMTPGAVREASVARNEIVLNHGFDVNFAPVADVALEPESFMIERSFGSDPHQVADSVVAFIQGAQDLNVISCAKHFPGHGRTPIDSHLDLPEVNVTYDTWRATDAIPFEAAIKAGVPMVMLGHLRYVAWEGWGDATATFNPVATNVLRNDLGFDGVIVTDEMGMGALSTFDPYDALDRAIDAGADMLIYVFPPVPVEELVNHLVARVESGDLSPDRIAESVARIHALRAIGATPGTR